MPLNKVATQLDATLSKKNAIGITHKVLPKSDKITLTQPNAAIVMV